MSETKKSKECQKYLETVGFKVKGKSKKKSPKRKSPKKSKSPLAKLSLAAAKKLLHPNDFNQIYGSASPKKSKSPKRKSPKKSKSPKRKSSTSKKMKHASPDHMLRLEKTPRNIPKHILSNPLVMSKSKYEKKYPNSKVSWNRYMNLFIKMNQ